MENNSYLDEDGYPTEETLKKIALWDYNDPEGWFDFIKPLWMHRDWGWHESIEMDGIKNKQVCRLYISTGGWSGNESIITAMRENSLLWHFQWYSSRRGGHYIFEKEIPK